jgi:hypothetical protein
MELDRGQQRPEGLKEKLVDFGSPRENQGGGELLSEEGKKEKEKEGLGVIWGAPTTRRWPRWCSVPESREKRGWGVGDGSRGG